MSGSPKSLAVIEKQPLRQCASVKELLWNESAKKQLASVAAKHLNPEQMMRAVANSLRTTPKLAECEPMSFLGALMDCAAIGLQPNIAALGHAYLVPFFNGKKKVFEVQVIVGYRGLIDLARRSGHITSISAGVHYDDDDLWEYEEGTDAKLRHGQGNQDGAKLHAYAVAKFRDGGHAFVVLPWKHVLRIRDGSQNWQSAVKFGSTDRNPWKTHEDAMAMKTAIRALAKYLPLSVEFVRAVDMDETNRDYGSFALNPAMGEPPLEESVDPETGEITPAAIEEKREVPMERVKAAEPEPARRAAAQTATQKAAPAAVEPAGDIPTELLSVLERLEGEIADAASAGPEIVDDMLALWGDQIAVITGHPAAKARLEAAIAAAKQTEG